MRFEIPKLIEYSAFATIIGTVFLFASGHILAYFYYSEFEIEYFKLTDSQTAFSFALESINILAAFLGALAVIAFFIFLIVTHKIDSNFDRISGKVKTVASIATLVSITLVTTYMSFDFATHQLNSHSLKEDIQRKRYIPLEVIYNKGNRKLLCVTSIGTIGQYTVFITQKMQTVLLQSSDIISISTMFYPVPVVVIDAFSDPKANPNHELEVDMWEEAWKSKCKSDESFIKFDFAKSSLDIEIFELKKEFELIDKKHKTDE